MRNKSVSLYLLCTVIQLLSIPYVSSSPNKHEHFSSERSLLALDEVPALANIFQSCCPTGCSLWTPFFESKATQNSTCSVPRVVCNQSGRIESLDLRGKISPLNNLLPVDNSPLNAWGSKTSSVIKILISCPSHIAGFLLNCTAVDFFTEVSKLDSLKDLELSGNAGLQGSLGTTKASQGLPPLCSAVQNGLETVNLDTTGIDGEVPSCLFAEASSLRDLSLSNTQVTFLEDGFSTDSKLEVLNANKVQMARVPATIAFLPSLRRLKMSDNGMKGQVPQFASKYMQEVDLSKNNLTGGIPHALTTHPSLTRLDLSFNNLTALPIEWKSLVYTNISNTPFPLREIKLSNNNIQEPFPGGLAYYPSLSILDIADNLLEGPVGNYSKGFESMQSLDISNNQLFGNIPAWMQRIKDLNSRNSGLNSAANSEVDTNDDDNGGGGDESSGLSGGAIAGITIGVLCGVSMIGIVAIVVVKKTDLKGGKWKWQPQHLLPNNGDGVFERFSDESGAVELGKRGNTYP